MHLSTAGGVFTAAERAQAMGANTFQIFSSSQRMWRPSKISADHCEQMKKLRVEYDCSPLVIHASYLINLCAQSEEVRRNSSDVCFDLSFSREAGLFAPIPPWEE